MPVPQRAVEIGAEVVQIFNTNPRMWRTRVPAPGEVVALTAGLHEHRLRLFFHTIYLINLATPDAELRQRSISALAQAWSTGALAGAEAVVTHIGSHRGDGPQKARTRVADSISRAFDLALDSLQTGATTPGDASTLPLLLLETGTGAGNTLGGRLEDLAALLVPELGICIDTAHLFAAGFPLHDEEGLEELIAHFRALGLLGRIGLVHLNDSSTPFGSRRDVHANLGDGVIGYEALARVVRHPAMNHIPFVLEVPGADGHGPDAANLRLAKRMRSGLGPPARGARPRARATAGRTPARKRPAQPAT